MTKPHHFAKWQSRIIRESRPSSHHLSYAYVQAFILAEFMAKKLRKFSMLDAKMIVTSFGMEKRKHHFPVRLFAHPFTASKSQVRCSRRSTTVSIDTMKNEKKTQQNTDALCAENKSQCVRSTSVHLLTYCRLAAIVRVHSSEILESCERYAECDYKNVCLATATATTTLEVRQHCAVSVCDMHTLRTDYFMSELNR